ncbi:hypothetical protein M407DRAFT_22948 [Tulasnella calospora MUT 4182]|uniref:Uncharacterized protein n=1 Tax=Tulasnella calospora MUT 4182 TaxID=1051891 RepID=A0A0C3QLZ1_9AGAM|nr:hypothetical protein M407DRAFT_22948 [Tulasnella calospora MUT 4182]
MDTPPNNTNEEEQSVSGGHYQYGVFAFEAPSDTQTIEMAFRPGRDLEGSPRRVDTSETLSTPYSPSIATPNTYFGSITVQSPHRGRIPISPTSQARSTALQTASSRPPFAFLAPPESAPSSFSSLNTQLNQHSVSKVEPSEPDREEKSIGSVENHVIGENEHSYAYPFSQAVGEEDSPYPEVRASVSNTDDPDMPTLTFRMWSIGIILCFFRAGFNFFFYLRWPSPWISDILVVIVAYPLGKTLDRFLPIHSWNIPSCFPVVGGRPFSLNPGPFNIKEHALIFMMSGAALTPAYGMLMVIATEKDYGFSLGIGFSFLFLFSTEITGFSLAAITRELLIYPASVIWPNSLVQSTLLNTLHAEEEKITGHLSRYRFLVICGVAAFLYHFLPGFLFTALSSFSWACWITPNNAVVNQLFGTVTGLGMGLITFDWTQIGYISSPLIVPWYVDGFWVSAGDLTIYLAGGQVSTFF